MNSGLSARGTMSRYDAGVMLTMMMQEVCEEPVIYATAGSDATRIHATCKVNEAHGFNMDLAVKEANRKVGGGGIFLTQVMEYIKNKEGNATRIIVVTDEQDCSGRGYEPEKADAFGEHNYIMNVAADKNGIAYTDKWVHVHGFSDKVVDYIQEYEKIF
jgi:hypothetical protein